MVPAKSKIREVPGVPARIRNLILDMDGVLWRGETPTAGLAEFFATIQDLGFGYVLVTNNSTRNARDYADKLARFGVGVPVRRILTSGEATAEWLAGQYPSGTKVCVIGERSLRNALSIRGFKVLDREDDRPRKASVPLVVVGLDRQARYSELARASSLVASGARFVGTNPDTSLPEEDGVVPGAGALLAAIRAATGVEPEVVGKPAPLLFRHALSRLGSTVESTAVVGDRIDTDIAGGRRQGLYTILVLTGVTRSASLAANEIQPDAVFEDIRSLAGALSSKRE